MGLETTILGTKTFVIPAKAGIQSTVYSKSWTGLGPSPHLKTCWGRLRWDDGILSLNRAT